MVCRAFNPQTFQNGEFYCTGKTKHITLRGLDVWIIRKVLKLEAPKYQFQYFRRMKAHFRRNLRN